MEELSGVVREYLALFMDEGDAARFADLSAAVESIRQNDPPWQAAVSIGVYADIVRKMKRQAGLLDGLVETLEAHYQSLKAEVTGEALHGEQGRLLLHVRFALGLVQLARGEEAWAWRLLSDLTMMPLARRGHATQSGLAVTRDVGMGKLIALEAIEPLYREEEDWGLLARLATEVLACWPENNMAAQLLMSAIESWASYCEGGDELDPDLHLPWYGWLDVFMASEEMLSLCKAADPPGELPGACGKASAQFVAWKIGSIVGRFALSMERHCPGFWGKPLEFLEYRATGGETYSAEWGEQVDRAFRGVLALCCDLPLGPGPDWGTLRDRYVRMWERSCLGQGGRFSEIGPASDVYWAARIGFADSMMEAQRESADAETASISVVPTGADLITQLAGMSVQVAATAKWTYALYLKQPPDAAQVRADIRQHGVGRVWEELPTGVVDYLVTAEMLYRTGTKHDQATVEFVKAAEAGWWERAGKELVSELRGRNEKQMHFPCEDRWVSRDIGRLVHEPLSGWGQLLERIVLNGRDMGQLPVGKWRETLNRRFGELPPDRLMWIAKVLERVQKLRSGSAHARKGTSRFDVECEALEELRRVVFGPGGETSVIAEICELFQPRARRAESGPGGG